MFLNEPLNVRITERIFKDIENILTEDDGEKYQSTSHFARCALIKLIREEKNGR